jgi:hypothetical protein
MGTFSPAGTGKRMVETFSLDNNGQMYHRHIFRASNDSFLAWDKFLHSIVYKSGHWIDCQDLWRETPRGSGMGKGAASG